jgi:hypothetical protein
VLEDYIGQYDGTQDVEDSDDEGARDNHTPPEGLIRKIYARGMEYWYDLNRPPSKDKKEEKVPSSKDTNDADGEAAEDNGAQTGEPDSQQDGPCDTNDEDEIFISEHDLGRTKILTMNVRSAVSDEKKALIKLGVNKIDPDVIIMTETWFNRNDGEFRIHGYKPVARCDRPTRPDREPPKARGGGVLALAKTDIKITNAEVTPLHRDIQIVKFVIDKITVFGIYSPIQGKQQDNNRLA